MSHRTSERSNVPASASAAEYRSRVRACAVRLLTTTTKYIFVATMLTYTNLLLVWVVDWCVSQKLNPLENNDKLRDISNLFIAEWQWESWSVKQDASGPDLKSPGPGPRINAALWKDNTGPNWFLFGGQPVDNDSSKIYSDIWKYSISTRTWERVFPSQIEMRGKNQNKIGGMMTLRANLFDDGHYRKASHRRYYNIVLCGRGVKKNSTKTNKKTMWSNLTRRKKQEPNTKADESKSLAVYGPRTAKSNTVWQIDLKDKLWTAYVCCCDTSNNDKSSPKIPKMNSNKTKEETLVKISNSEYQNLTSKNGLIKNKIDKTEDKVDAEQQHLNITSSKLRKKKLGQIQKKKNEAQYSKKLKESELTNEDPESDTAEHVSVTTENKEIDYLNNSRTIHIFENIQFFTNESTQKSPTENKKLKIRKVVNNTKVEENSTKIEGNFSDVGNSSSDRVSPKIASKYCPDFPKDGQPVSWCDGNNDVLITSDLSSPQIVLWLFNLKTSHWSQQEITTANDTIWPGCSDFKGIRYAGNGEQVYIICTAADNNENSSVNSSWSTIEPSKNPSELEPISKSVFRIDSKRKILENLGRINLSPYFKTAESREIWENETKSVLHIFRTPDNLTVLILAYEDVVDLWVLTEGSDGKFNFEQVEKIWRGSALKWFTRYNAALYNLQFVSDSDVSETVFVTNPRLINKNEYWPRERGRFIIRILKNENLKNKSFENRTREQNLTYELLQSDFKPSSHENQFVHNYSFKMLIFFGISLAIFATFGFVIFFKRCVTCPTRIRIRAKSHKSPPIIRYSVIPDDLLYPVA